MKYNKLNRRMFLQGLSGTILPIPFLGSLLPKIAWGQSTLPKKYYIGMICTHEYGFHDNWVPSLQTPGLSMTPSGSHAIHYARLTNYAPSTGSSLSPAMRTTLNSYINQMSIVRGLDSWWTGGHNWSHVFGNPLGREDRTFVGRNFWKPYANPTIDQILASNSRFNPNRGPSLILGTEDEVTNGTASFGLAPNGELVSKPRIGNSPFDIYQKAFFFGKMAESNAPSQFQRQDVLNDVMQDYSSLMGSRGISTSDRRSLENIMDTYADVQRSINQAYTNSCSHSTLDTTSDTTKLATSSLTHQNYAKLLAAAIKCDLTRTAVYQVHVTPDYSSGDYHQEISHTPHGTVGGVSNKIRHANNTNGYLQVVKHLCDELASSVDSSNGQTYLYNSLVHVSMESSLVHDAMSVPTLLIGNAGGAINQGNYIDLTDRSKTPYGAQQFSDDPTSPIFSHSYPGYDYNRLLVTIAQAMGLTPSEYVNAGKNSHLLNLSDASYGAHNNGISSIGGFGVMNVPPTALESGYSRSEYLRKASNYNFHHSGLKLPVL